MIEKLAPMLVLTALVTGGVVGSAVYVLGPGRVVIPENTIIWRQGYVPVWVDNELTWVEENRVIVLPENTRVMVPIWIDNKLVWVEENAIRKDVIFPDNFFAVIYPWPPIKLENITYEILIQDNYVITVENLRAQLEREKRWIPKKVNENLEIAVLAPEYLSMSTFENRVPNPVEVYVKRMGSAGRLKVDIEVGIKIRIPSLSLHVFVDVDLEILGIDRPDFYEFEWQIYPTPGAPTMTLADLEEGHVGVIAYGVPSKELGEDIEITALAEKTWVCVGSENIYVLKDPRVPERVQLSFPLDVTIGPLEVKE